LINKISNIVFTKNRPLQLGGYLESLHRHFPAELVQSYVLYKQELFNQEYGQLFAKYPDCIVIKESDFSSDFFKILNRINTKYILFGIDDVVYFDSVDFELIDNVFENFAEEIFGFSLRIGLNTIEDGKDEIDNVTIRNQTIHKVNWKTGQTQNTRYPFELCATIYRTDLVKKIINSSRNNNLAINKLFLPGSVLMRALSKAVSMRSILKSFGYFFNPNTLESWNCRWCQNHSLQLPGFLYFQKLCASAVQVNMVNTSTKNEFDNSAELTVEALAEKYKQGYRLDINALEKNKPTGSHCGHDYFSLVKIQ